MNRPGEDATTPEMSALERAVLLAALRGDASHLPALREQAAAARVLRRTPSGVGFVTRLGVPDELPRADGIVPVVRGRHPLLPAGAEFLVQVAGGRLNSIEAFCYDGSWPADESLFELEP